MRSNEPMTIDQIRDVCPAVFAKQRDPERTTDAYTFVDTEQVVKGLMDNGFGVFRAQQKRTHNVDDMAYTRHMLAFRPLEGYNKMIVGDSIPEALLISAHDGKCSFNLMAGLFRLVCLNGMVVGQNFQTIKVVHKGDILQDVMDGIDHITEFLPKLHEFHDRCLSTKLTKGRQESYAQDAMKIRHKEATPYEPAKLLTLQRPEDKGNDLWHTFQRVQENLMRGGIEGQTATGRRSVSRPINRVTKDVIYNRALWDLTEEYLEAA